MSAFRTLILDLGDVLLTWSAETTTAIPPRQLKAMMSSPTWQDYERGRLTQAAAYARIAAEFAVPVDAVDEAFRQARSSIRADSALLALVRGLKARCALRDWSVFDCMYGSAVIGERKPDRAAYDKVLQDADIDPATAVFVDDKVENVEAARALGIHGIVFDTQEDADIIFRSGDGVHFNLYKVIVAKASSVMKDMFALPDTSLTPQIVELTEDAESLEHLFRLICPVKNPTLTSVDALSAVLKAAHKYDMQAVTEDLLPIARQLISTDPLRIYAVAYVLELEELAREAAWGLLDDYRFITPVDPPPEFSTLPALATYLAEMYRIDCAGTALRIANGRHWTVNGRHHKAVEAPEDVKNSWAWVACPESPETCPLGEEKIDITAPPHRRYGPKVLAVVTPREWWLVYMDALCEELRLHPTPRTVRQFIDHPGALRALREASDCPTCVRKARDDLVDFNQLLSQKIEDALQGIRIKLPFAPDPADKKAGAAK
ncbi:HAD-like domain-containing protein [Epithele typhae]|uniref:HAD-like domain-containing protein n=1 Tax=Epithele typhae TaxID=378194 RepID=UPI002008007D|nr:HAD-like domain-containing protein [Epithele typhae]KAH9942389.1 HAD-like domain-containing protein [Epithele typhae]